MNNKRLQLISDIFTEKIIFDIGSDHGYLIRDLIEKNKVKLAHVVEINKAPLENAKRNLNNYKNVVFHLSDGLKSVDVVECNSNGFVIAGMGGELITQILEASITKFEKGVLYLQANNKEPELRQFLVDNNFKINNEYVVVDKNKSYFIIKAEVGHQVLNMQELICGKNVQISKDYIFKLKDMKNHLEKLLSNLEKNNIQNTEIINKYEIIKQVLGEIDEN